MTNYHLVILKKPYIEAIINGCKTVESRFTKTQRGAFSNVQPSDKLFLKISSGPVCATATVLAVKKFKNLCPIQISRIKTQYNPLIAANDEYWQSIADCKYGCLVWLKNIIPIEPITIQKKDWRAWVVLKAGSDYGLLKKNTTKTR